MQTSYFVCATEPLDVGDDSVSSNGSTATPGGINRLRTGTVTSDNAYLEEAVSGGHQFDPRQFERLYLLGKGDVGRVYLCRTKGEHGKLCAIKVLDQVGCIRCSRLQPQHTAAG